MTEQTLDVVRAALREHEVNEELVDLVLAAVSFTGNVEVDVKTALATAAVLSTAQRCFDPPRIVH